MPDSAVELELGCGFAAEIRNELSHSLLNFKVSKTEAAYRSIRFALRLVSSLAGDFLKRHAKAAIPKYERFACGTQARVRNCSRGHSRLLPRSKRWQNLPHPSTEASVVSQLRYQHKVRNTELARNPVGRMAPRSGRRCRREVQDRSRVVVSSGARTPGTHDRLRREEM